MRARSWGEALSITCHIAGEKTVQLGMPKAPPTPAPATPEDPVETVKRIRRLAANWRLGHYEGDLGVAWDEAAVALLAVLENPNVTHYEIGLDHAVTVRHDPIGEGGRP